MRTIFNARFWLALTLVVIGVIVRVMPHPWNFAPIGAIALFGGARFDRRYFAVGIPLVTMLIGDAFIGFHSLMPVIYATYALIAVIGMFLRDALQGRDRFVIFAEAQSEDGLLLNFNFWIVRCQLFQFFAGLLADLLAEPEDRFVPHLRRI